MLKMEEPSRTWEISHMDWVTGLPPGANRRYNSCLVIVERFSKTQISLISHKDDTAMETALLLWNRVILWNGIFTHIISYRDTKFTSEPWKNLHKLSGTKLPFYTAYHPQSYGLAERMIKTLEDMVRRIREYGLELKDCDELKHYLCTLLSALELAYKSLFMLVSIKLLLFHILLFCFKKRFSGILVQNRININTTVAKVNMLELSKISNL
ncbi:hypothetical protein O181_037159 [Austropuccinia psidii MF-1]|uniref:Integrase catalytic domain-containing protein n=1 Tax=Austropuccinia psidii MF-1 TaxID=1389203 RepID=A0A9Q3D603_9BASI|nr:hypothetical protein [Austropuccinia psidii MF-1]